MGYDLTPAVERAFAAAARWALGPTGDVGPIGPVETMMGLLHESECRAARLLKSAGIDEAAVRGRWPELAPTEYDADTAYSVRGLGAAVEASLREACTRLDENLRSFQFATEHVLLGLTLADDDVGTWLRERGVDAEAIERDHARLYGGDRSPIAVDLEPIPLADVVESAPVSRVAGDSANQQTDARRVTMRIIDAAANRSGEALRVVEDHARFVLNDAALVRECKAIRHELAAALVGFSAAERLAARDTVGDVGTSLSIESEMTRGSPADVAAANIRRLQESLRSLEEYAKLLDPEAAARCEALRYRSYTLQKSLAAPGATRPTLDDARLYVLLDGRNDAEAFATLARAIIDAGADVVQLRDKRLDDFALLARARQLRALTAGTNTRFILNDRADLSVAADADGVHVGQEDLSVADVRRIVGPNHLVGVSTHSIAQARQAAADGADYLGVGPVFPGETKSFAQYPGLELVRAVSAEIRLPAFAIGGITPDNVAQIVQAGLHRVAVSGAVMNAADPAEAVRSLICKLRQ
jgi:thiamine-phosphate pyrophosphorylase